MNIDLTPEAINAIVELQKNWQDYEDAYLKIYSTIIDERNSLSPENKVLALRAIRLIGRAIRPIYNDKR